MDMTNYQRGWKHAEKYWGKDRAPEPRLPWTEKGKADFWTGYLAHNLAASAEWFSEMEQGITT